MNNDAKQFLDIQIKTKFQGLANHSTTTKLIISRYTEHTKFQCKFTTKKWEKQSFYPKKITINSDFNSLNWMFN